MICRFTCYLYMHNNIYHTVYPQTGSYAVQSHLSVGVRCTVVHMSCGRAGYAQIVPQSTQTRIAWMIILDYYANTSVLLIHVICTENESTKVPIMLGSFTEVLNQGEPEGVWNKQDTGSMQRSIILYIRDLAI